MKKNVTPKAYVSVFLTTVAFIQTVVVRLILAVDLLTSIFLFLALDYFLHILVFKVLGVFGE